MKKIDYLSGATSVWLCKRRGFSWTVIAIPCAINYITGKGMLYVQSPHYIVWNDGAEVIMEGASPAIFGLE